MSMAISRSDGRITEINVTPMADVIIVLLIIFMVAIPLLSDGPVHKLPEAANARSHDQGPIVISIAADMTLFVGGKPLARQELPDRLRQAFEASRDRLVHLKADASLPYSTVSEVLEVCRRAGAEEVAFIATPRPRS